MAQITGSTTGDTKKKRRTTTTASGHAGASGGSTVGTAGAGPANTQTNSDGNYFEPKIRQKRKGHEGGNTTTVLPNEDYASIGARTGVDPLRLRQANGGAVPVAGMTMNLPGQAGGRPTTPSYSGVLGSPTPNTHLPRSTGNVGLGNLRAGGGGHTNEPYIPLNDLNQLNGINSSGFRTPATNGFTAGNPSYTPPQQSQQQQTYYDNMLGATSQGPTPGGLPATLPPTPHGSGPRFSETRPGMGAGQSLDATAPGIADYLFGAMAGYDPFGYSFDENGVLQSAGETAIDARIPVALPGNMADVIAGMPEDERLAWMEYLTAGYHYDPYSDQWVINDTANAGVITGGGGGYGGGGYRRYGGGGGGGYGNGLYNSVSGGLIDWRGVNYA